MKQKSTEVKKGAMKVCGKEKKEASMLKTEKMLEFLNPAEQT